MTQKKDPWAELEESVKAQPPKGARSLKQIGKALGILPKQVYDHIDPKKFETGLFKNPESHRNERYYWPKES